MQFSTRVTPNPAKIKTGCIVVGVYSGRQLSPEAEALDRTSRGAITKLLQQGDLNGKLGTALLHHQPSRISAERLLMVGLGKNKTLSRADFQKLARTIGNKLSNCQAKSASLLIESISVDATTNQQCAAQLVRALLTSTYRLNELKSKPKGTSKGPGRVAFCISQQDQVNTIRKGVRLGEAIGKGMKLSKDLANRPGNICTPTHLADEAEALAEKLPVKTSILDEAQMEELGMGALLSVSRGSRQPAKLIVMEYQGGDKDAAPVALVGKGLTFDAGGISLKPAASMDEMKYDMCGGATVFGVLKAAAEQKLGVNLVGIVPSSENLPDGQANKPGDIVTSLSGQTIEILNTDAEGRLILCDALTYVERFNPAIVIDIATLTGACMVALGKHASGLFSNDDKLAEDLLAAGERSGDRVWRLPVWPEYDAQLKSRFADIANIGGRYAGAVTAACFLGRFTGSYRWAHLDIAGTAWNSGILKGATGRPVPLLMEYLTQYIADQKAT